MNVRNVGGVLIAGGLACLLFYGAAFVYWVSNKGAFMTKVLLLTGVVALALGGLLFALSTAGTRR